MCLEKRTDNFFFKPLEPFGLFVQPKKSRTLVIDKDQLFAWLKKYKLVLFRGFDSLAKEQFIDQALALGDLLEWEFGYVMEMQAMNNASNYLFTNLPVPFHWDGAFHQEPKYLLFNCIQAPPANYGGETLFSDTEKVYLTASNKERAFWRQIILKYETEKLAHYGDIVKVKLLQQHPDKNTTIMRFAEPVPENYPNPVSAEILGLSEPQSQTSIKQLAERFYEKKFCYQHEWQPDDFLIADNFSLIHGRNAYHKCAPRHLRRIQLLNSR